MKDISKHYEAVKKFNLRAGNRTADYGTLEFWRELKSQHAITSEEFDETLEAIELGDLVGLIDGICDVHFTLAWFTEQLANAGFDVDLAMSAVCDNNMTKIFNSYTEAAETADYHESLGVDGVYIKNSVVDGKDYFTVRNNVGKILKPKGFKSVELEAFVPKE